MLPRQRDWCGCTLLHNSCKDLWMRESLIVKQLSRFSIVGLLASMLYMLLNIVFLKVFQASLIVSSIVAHVIVVFITFHANHSWTFMAQGEKREYLLRYLLVSGISMAVNAVVIVTMQANFPEYTAVAIVVVLLVVPVVNFVFHKYWTFVGGYHAS